MQTESIPDLLNRIKNLEARLEESEQLIDAIKAGEVDAFALSKDDGAEIFTLHSGDYAYRVLVENFNEGALNLSEDGLIVYSNIYFPHLLELTYESVVGNSIFDFIDPSSKSDFESLFKKGLAGQAKGEICLRTGSRTIPVYVSLTSLFPNVPSVGMIITDLSEKKQHEEMLETKNRDMEEKNRELAQTNKELASFAYIASHDLQEPLRKIQTFAALIMEKEYAHLSRNGQDYFERLRMSARRMQTLIEDLLMYSRTNTIERVFESYDLEKIVEEVKEEMNEEFLQKGASIEMGPMCKAPVIPFQMRQLVHNLFNNSLKFSINGTPPVIKVSSVIEKGAGVNGNHVSGDAEYCHIRISDNGIGFDAQYSEKIFDVFQRLHGKSEYEGTGIGLSIVKKIVDNHNGLVTASGEPGKGARFDVYIPVN